MFFVTWLARPSVANQPIHPLTFHLRFLSKTRLLCFSFSSPATTKNSHDGAPAATELVVAVGSIAEVHRQPPTEAAGSPTATTTRQEQAAMHVSAQIKKKKHVVRRSIPPRIDNPFNDRRDKCPWRTSLMAAFLFSVGVIFLTAGLWKWFNTDDRKGAIAMITLGSLSAFFVGVVRDLSACLWVFVREGDCHLVAIIEGTHRRLFFLRRYPPPHHTPLVHRLPKLVLLRCFLMLGPFCPPPPPPTTCSVHSWILRFVHIGRGLPGVERLPLWRCPLVRRLLTKDDDWCVCAGACACVCRRRQGPGGRACCALLVAR